MKTPNLTIKQAIDKSGLTIQEISDQLLIAPETVRSWTMHDNVRMSVRRLIRFCEVVNVEPADLLPKGGVRWQQNSKRLRS